MHMGLTCLNLTYNWLKLYKKHILLNTNTRKGACYLATPVHAIDRYSQGYSVIPMEYIFQKFPTKHT